MKSLQDSFIFIFSIIYPFLRSHFVSYIIYLACICGCAWAIWKLFKKQNGKSPTTLLIKASLIGLELYLISYAAWFVIVHFPTFQFMK